MLPRSRNAQYIISLLRLNSTILFFYRYIFVFELLLGENSIKILVPNLKPLIFFFIFYFIKVTKIILKTVGLLAADITSMKPCFIKDDIF